MKKSKRIVFAVIMLLLVSVIAGCGGKSSKNANTIDKNTIYREQTLNITLPENGSVNYVQLVNGKIFMCGYAYTIDAEGNYNSGSFVSTVNEDGSGYNSIKFGDASGNSWIDRMLVTEDGTVNIFYNSYFEDYSDPNNYIYENSYRVAQYDSNLVLKRDMDLGEKLGLEWISTMFSLPNNRYFLGTYEKAVIVDNNFNVIKEIAVDQNKSVNQYFVFKNGKMACSYWGDNGEEYAYVNPDTLEVGEKFEINGLGYNKSVMQGVNYDFLLSSSDQIYGYNIGDAEPTPLINFINSDISTSYFDCLVESSDGSFIGVYSEYNGNNYEYKISKFTKVNPEDVVDKEIISLGCLYLDYDIRRQVLQFNKTNEKYRITVKDYESYSTNEDWQAGQKKLNSDIASGQAPDIIVSSEASTINDYVTKGLFKDLKPFIEDDPEIDINDIFPNLITALSYKDKLYTVTPYFYVQTLVGKKSVLGDKKSWTFAEMLEFEKTLPEGSSLFFDVARADFLTSMIDYNASEYINMAEAKCYFDTENFKNLLQYAKTLPIRDDKYYDNIDYSDYDNIYRKDKAVLLMSSISNISSLKYTEQYTFGEEIAFIGYPSSSGTGSSIFYNTGFSISSKCKSPEAAWEFIRYYLTDEYQNTLNYGIPASMKRFDAQGVEACKKREEKEEPVYDKTYALYDVVGMYMDDGYYINGVWTPAEPYTPADIARIKEAVLSATKTSGYYEDIIDIINEEAEPFFEGQKSVDEVVKIIQSRATIYINEKQ